MIKKTKSVIIAIMAVALMACEGNAVPDYEPDQELRHKFFMECLAAIPDGPEQTEYNDWGEVVSECGHFAYKHSLRCIADCAGVPSANKLKGKDNNDG